MPVLPATEAASTAEAGLETTGRAGVSGWTKIECGRRSIGYLVTRRVVRFFRTEAWSWFQGGARRFSAISGG